jgi:hypothetical protein
MDLDKVANRQLRLVAGASRWPRFSRLWLISILLTGLVLRSVVLWATDPLIWSDSSGYLYQAQGIMNGDLSRDVGVRTPAYPLLIILAGNDINRTVNLATVFPSAL